MAQMSPLQVIQQALSDKMQGTVKVNVKNFKVHRTLLDSIAQGIARAICIEIIKEFQEYVASQGKLARGKDDPESLYNALIDTPGDKVTSWGITPKNVVYYYQEEGFDMSKWFSRPEALPESVKDKFVEWAKDKGILGQLMSAYGSRYKGKVDPQGFRNWLARIIVRNNSGEQNAGLLLHTAYANVIADKRRIQDIVNQSFGT